MLTLWNTYSFWVLYANAEGLGPSAIASSAASGTQSAEARTELDRWALSRLQGTVRTVIEGMDAYDCTSAGRAIADYVEDLSNWYVRASRRRAARSSLGGRLAPRPGSRSGSRCARR